MRYLGLDYGAKTLGVGISDETATVASTLKTKADEIHRVVDALKTVLLSRQTEAKLVALGGE